MLDFLFKREVNDEDGENSILGLNIDNSYKLISKYLPTGNEISDYEPLSEKVNVHRKELWEYYQAKKALLNEKKEKYENDYEQIKKYTKQNIITDKVGRNEKYANSILGAAGVYCISRVICNKNNWLKTATGSTKSTIGYLFTNLPSRIILPVVLPIWTFKTLTPQIYDNIVNSIERDLLPAKFVQRYHNFYNDIIIHKIRDRSVEIYNTSNEHLAMSIGNLRRIIIDKLEDNED